jgi:hypothetical protein
MHLFLCANENEVHGSGSSSIIQRQQQRYSATLHIAALSTHQPEELPLTTKTADKITTEGPTLRNKGKDHLQNTSISHLSPVHPPNIKPTNRFSHQRTPPLSGHQK